MSTDKAMEAAAKAIRQAWSTQANPTDRDIARAAISAYLKAVQKDKAVVEVALREALAIANDNRWTQADINDLRSLLRSALAALLRAKAEEET